MFQSGFRLSRCLSPTGYMDNKVGGGGQGGGSAGEQGAGGVREAGEERAGGGISTMAGSGREIQKVKLFFLLLLTSSQRNEPNNVS